MVLILLGLMSALLEPHHVVLQIPEHRPLRVPSAPLVRESDVLVVKEPVPLKVSEDQLFARTKRKTVFVEMNGCRGCVVSKGKMLPKLRAKGWIEGVHYEILDQSDMEKWDKFTTEYNIRSFPALVMIDTGESPHSIIMPSEGNDLVDYQDFVRMYYHGFYGHPNLRAQPRAAQPRAGYPLKQPSIYCDGWHHLLESPHAHYNFDPKWLKSLSNDEIQSLHSDAHENRVNWNYARQRQ